MLPNSPLERIGHRMFKAIRLRLYFFLVPSSKNPPAEPEAFRLLAPQRGLTAIGQNTSPCPKLNLSTKPFCGSRQSLSHRRVGPRGGNPGFPELSNFYCLPGRAGGSLIGLASPTSGTHMMVQFGA